ncbi:class E sortase [Streptomyces sp. RKAG337]|uniref:class E sortase n=1 Tax=Streptomyces sp. RKAG337 TaxID=2893404 RepID=UPI0020334F6F|nr:class E sortase [Streptomyces sp. RKAG337]MCM2427334.1 class E sortase [Streptomyces sp. RKAG337]
MTGTRPDEPPSYEDTGQFAVAVGQLADPLSDPLPGRGPLRPAPEAAEPPPTPASPSTPAPPASADVSGASDAGQEVIGSPWFRPHEMPQPASQQVPQQTPVAPEHQASAPPPAYDTAPAAYDEGYGTTYEGGYDSGYDAGTAVSAPAPVPTSTPTPVPTPTPTPPRVRRRGVPGETAQFPAVRPDGTPDESAGTEEPGATGATGAADETAATAAGAPATSAPAPGGRAERRKAAKQGAGHRARGRAVAGATTASEPAQTAPAAPAVPMTRLEARRAERAAKDSAAVILSRVIGEVFISVGVLMLLFVTYQLWWTNIRAHQQASGATSALQNQWNNDTSAKKNDDRKADAFSPGQGFAIMYIPKLDVKAPIAEGVSKHSVLDKGMIGHYTGALKTAMPWDKQGNFALAAHRNTHGEPFRYINKLVPGDKIVVETESTYYTYEMTSVLPSTSPSNVKVIQPVPQGSGFTKPGRYITLTTCTPEFTSTYRMIVWGKMVEERPRSQGKPAALPD